MEIKVRLSDSKSITLTGRDVKILLLSRNDTVTALAERIYCSRGGLSSFLSGKAELHKPERRLPLNSNECSLILTRHSLIWRKPS